MQITNNSKLPASTLITRVHVKAILRLIERERADRSTKNEFLFTMAPTKNHFYFEIYIITN